MLSRYRVGLLAAATLGASGAANAQNAPVPNGTSGSPLAEGHSPVHNARYAKLDGDAVVALHNLEVHYSKTDIEIPSVTMPLEFVRHYRSQTSYDGPLGSNWSHGYDCRLFIESGRLKQQSALVVFDYGSSGTLRECTTPGVYQKARAVSPGGEWEIRSRHGRIERYFAIDASPTSGRLRYIEDTAGNRITCGYNGAGKLVTITDQLGRSLTLDYGGGPRIMTVTDFAGRVTTYSYIGTDLATVSYPKTVGTPSGPDGANHDFPNGTQIKYGYSPSSATPATLAHNLQTVTYPNEVASGGPAVVTIAYASGKDVVQTATVGGNNASGVPAGGVMSFAQAAGQTGESGQTTFTDRRGIVREYGFNAAGQSLRIEVATTGIRPGDPATFTTAYTYNAHGETLQVTRENGQQVVLTWNINAADHFQRGNLRIQRDKPSTTSGTGPNDFVANNVFEPIYNRQLASQENGWQETLDYQEGSAGSSPLATMISVWGIDVGTFPVYLNQDLNGDGVTNQVAGKTIKEMSPLITLGQTTPYNIVRFYTYDDRGRLISSSTGEGALTVFAYDSAQSGQLVRRIADVNPNSPEARPNAGTALWNKPPSVVHVGARTDFAYDAVGNRIQETDERGVITTWLYNGQGRIIREKRATSYDVSRLDPALAALNTAGYGHLVKPDVETWNRYDANGNLIRTDVRQTAVGANGNPWVTSTFGFDIENRVVSQTDEISTTVNGVRNWRYNQNGDLVKTINADGVVAEVVYDERGLTYKSIVLGDTPAENSVTTYGYDLNGMHVSTSGPEDHDGNGTMDLVVTQYDARGRVARMDYANGSYKIKNYDEYDAQLGEQLFGTPGFGSPSTMLQWRDGLRDEIGRIHIKQVRQFQPTIAGLSLPYTPPATWLKSSVVMDRDGMTTRNTDEQQRVTLYSYDGFGRLLTTTDAVGNLTTHVYDAAGNLIQRTLVEVSGSTKRSYSVFDGLGREIRSTDALGRSTYRVHDSYGRVVAEADAEGPMGPDPLGLLGFATNAPGNTKRNIMNAAGHVVIAVVDQFPGGVGVGTGIWSSGFTATTIPSGSSNPIISRFGYDAVGRVTSVSSGAGRVESFQYDAMGRIKVKTHPDGSSERFTYWRDDLTKSHALLDSTGFEVRRIDYDYQPGGLIASKTVVTPAGSSFEGTTQQTYAHTGAGHIWSTSDDNGSGPDAVVQRVLDSFGVIVQENLNGRTMSRRFDAAGRRNALWYPDGRNVTFEWNNDHHLANVREGTGSLIASMTYAGQGRLKRTDFGGGVAAQSYELAPAAGGGVDGYDLAGSPIRIRHITTATDSLTYGRNRRGQTSTITREVGTAAAEVDAALQDSAGRLASWQKNVPLTGAPERTQAWRMDKDNAWTLFSEKVGAAAWLPYIFVPGVAWETQSIHGKSLDHDAAGNRIQDEWFDYFYDAFDRLVRVRGRFNSLDVVRYAYDCNGRRIQKVDAIAGVVTNYTYEEDQIIAEHDASGAMTAQYVFGEYLDQILQMRRGGQDYYYMTDSIGSVVSLVSSSGATLERYEYDPYGAPTFLSATGAPQQVLESAYGNPYLFNAREYDPETANYKELLTLGGYYTNWKVTGVYYYRNRYMDPAEGRFTSRDPLSQSGNMALDPSLLVERSLNRGYVTSPYDYVDAQPQDLVDPYGLQEESTGPGLRRVGPGRIEREMNERQDRFEEQLRKAREEARKKAAEAEEKAKGKARRAGARIIASMAAASILDSDTHKELADTSCKLVAIGGPLGVSACAHAFGLHALGNSSWWPDSGPYEHETRENSYHYQPGDGSFPYQVSCQIDENGRDKVNGADCRPPAPRQPTPQSDLASYKQDHYGNWQWQRDPNNLELCSANLPDFYLVQGRKAWKHYCDFTPEPSGPELRLRPAQPEPKPAPSPGPTSPGPTGPGAPGGAPSDPVGPRSPVGESFKISEQIINGRVIKSRLWDDALCGKKGKQVDSSPGNEEPGKVGALSPSRTGDAARIGVHVERVDNTVVARVSGTRTAGSVVTLRRVESDGALAEVDHCVTSNGAIVAATDAQAPIGATYFVDVTTGEDPVARFGPLTPTTSTSPATTSAVASFEPARDDKSLGVLALLALAGLVCAGAFVSKA